LKFWKTFFEFSKKNLKFYKNFHFVQWDPYGGPQWTQLILSKLWNFLAKFEGISHKNLSNSEIIFENLSKSKKEIFDSTFKKSFQKLTQWSSKCELWLCFIGAYLGLPVCNSIRSAYFCLVSFADVFANVFYICVDYKNIIIYTTSSHMSHLCIFTSADHDWLAWVLHYGESIMQQGGMLVQCKPVKPYVEFWIGLIWHEQEPDDVIVWESWSGVWAGTCSMVSCWTGKVQTMLFSSDMQGTHCLLHLAV